MTEYEAKRHEEIRDAVIPQLKIPLSQHLVGVALPDGRIGSGTLIRSSEKYGILTAHHVIHTSSPALIKNGQAKKPLVLVIQEELHRFELDPLEWTCHDIGVPPKEGCGPDICFVEMFSCGKLDTLKARKSFYSLDREPEKRMDFCLENSSGFFTVPCFIGEHTKIEVSRNGRHDTIIKPWIYLAGLKKDFAVEEGFDYGDLSVWYGEEELPKHFGGASGSGLWRCDLNISNTDDQPEYRVNGDPVLSGVLFSQTPGEGYPNMITCHGPRTVYEVVAEQIKKL